MRYRLPVEPAIHVLNEWVSRGHLYYWEREPSDIATKLLEGAVDGTIDYHTAIQILQSAETSKMPGHANRGLKYIHSEWKKLKHAES